MTRDEQLKYCKACSNHKFDVHKGVICSITNERASFEQACTLYNEDAELKHKAEMEAIRRSTQVIEVEKGTRFLNFIIDRVIMLILAFVMGVVLALINPVIIDSLDGMSTLMDYVITAILAVFYYTILEATTGQTIGKMITGTKVVDENGEKPDFGTIMVRSFSRIVPFDAFSFLGTKGWHDSWSNTHVVKA